MNRLVISGIKALLLSLGLIASLRAAQAADGDDDSVGPLVTLLASLPNPVAAKSQEVPPPPPPVPAVPTTGNDAGGAPSQVPSAVPLPSQTAPAAGQGSSTPAPSGSPRPTQSGQEPTRTPERPAPNRVAGEVRSPDIQFDRDGLVSMHTNEFDVRQVLELISRRSGMNILVSPKVSGTITSNFETVTFKIFSRQCSSLPTWWRRSKAGFTSSTRGKSSTDSRDRQERADLDQSLQA